MPSQRRWSVALLFALLPLAIQIARAGTLSSIAPAGVSTGQAINITGTGFDPTASNNTVTLTPTTGMAMSATGTAIALLDSATGLRRLTITVPEGLPVGTTAVRVTNRTTGEVSEARPLEIVTLSLPDSVSAAPGATSVVVRVTGSPNSQFVAGSTRAAFGAGITVRSTTVDSATSLRATIDVASTAALGPRDVAVISPTQRAVLKAGFAMAAPPTNQPPVVNAGADQTITLPATATLTGTVTDDGLPTGGAVTNTWTQASGPGTVTFGNATSASTTASFDQAGTYVLRLTASDSALSAFDEATITVAPAPNHAPTADIGGGSSSAKAGQPVQFNATGSTDADNDPLAYSWNFGDQTTATGPSPIHTYAAAGTFTVTLTVDDGKGGIASATTQVQVAPAALGRGIITGRVFNDVDGLPVPGAIVNLVSVDGSPGPFDHPQAQTDALGRYRLSSPVGSARLRISKDGFTGADRTVAVADAQRVNPLDARLTPLDAKATTVTSVLGNAVTNAAGDLRLSVAAGALDADASMRMTRVTGLGLAAALPAGWSPVAAVDISPAPLTLRTSAPLTVPAPSNLPAGAAVTVVRRDPSSDWIVAGFATRTADDASLQFALPQTGQYAFVIGDAAALPPGPAVGQPLAGVAAATSTATVTITPSPKILFASSSAHAQVRVLVTPAGAMTSGTPLQLDVSESYALAGGSFFLTRTPRTLPLYRFTPAGAADAPAPLESRIAASPSRSFSAFQLQRGTIDLAARLPVSASAPYGALITSDGGAFTVPTGERIVVSASATADDLPVGINHVDLADLPPILPATVTAVGAIELDLHGSTLTQPASLSIPLPSGIAAGTQRLVLRISDAGGFTQPELVAVAAQQGNALVTVTDVFGDGSVVLPGIRREGWYIFATANQPIGFVTGVASASDGQPLDGAVVSTGFGIVALTGADGRYAIAASPGAATITTKNVSTGDQTTTTAQVVAGAGASQSVSVGQTPLTVASIAPAAGATGVALASSIRVAFSAPIDPASVTGGVTLTSGGSAVAGTLTLSTDAQTLVFRPASLLVSNTSYQISVGGALRGANGRAIAAPAVSLFTTIDLTPPPAPAAGAITATIPDATNTSIVSGTQGSVDPTSLVLIKNVRTGAITTLTPNADGSFSGSVVALKSDQLQMTIRSAAGVTTAVGIPPFRNADGSVIVGSAGGRVDGPGGTFADVPAGALPDGTVVKVGTAALADFHLDAPAEFPFVGGITLDTGGVKAQKEIHIGVAAPPGALPDDQVLVVQALQLPLRRAWTVIDRAHLADGRYVSESPPFAGVTLPGAYGMLKVNGSCVSYVAVRFDYSIRLLATIESLPFFYPVGTEVQVPMPAVCDQTLTVTLLDPNTEAEVRSATYVASAVKDDIIMEPDVVTDDRTPPIVLSVNNPTGISAVNALQVVFSKTMNDDLLMQNFAVKDSRGNTVAGRLDIQNRSTIAAFYPALPFLLGEHYSILLYGLADTAGNLLDSPPLTFTPFTPKSLNLLQGVPAIRQALEKCSGGVCTSAAGDVATIGPTLFIANGLRTFDEQYRDPTIPVRLLAVDVSDPSNPTIIGVETGTLNPRVLATVDHASFFAQPAGVPFNGDLLLVESGGRTSAGLLATELGVYDVTACTRRPVAVSNCLAGAIRGFKRLSTAEGLEPSLGIPPETGLPQQLAALHQASTPPGSDTVVAYAVVSGIGIEAVDVTQSFNASTPSASRAPDGLVRGDYVDVAVLKNKLMAVGRDVSTNEPRLTMFTGQLGHLLDIPPPPPPGLTGLNGAARVAAAENMVFDVDGDGRVGADEDADGDPTSGRDELFDIAIVSSGSYYSGCPGAPPCGDLYIVDVSSQTDLAHAGAPRILDVITLPGAPFSLQIDALARLAYVEVRGRGLAVVDLSYLIGILRGTAEPHGFRDSNVDGLDDRVLRIIPTGGGANDIVMTRVKVDTARGIAFVSGASSGIEFLQTANKATELAVDFGDEPPAQRSTLDQEKRTLKAVIDLAVARVRSDLTQPSLPIYVLEQGSGSCFWRVPGDPAAVCQAFQPGVSDHDLEFFVPEADVPAVQDALDNFLDGENRPDELDTFGDLSMFAMPVEPLQNAELLNGTPLYRTGDTSGDLGMGRQTLLLLWLLEGSWVADYEGFDLGALLAKLKAPQASDNGIFPPDSAGKLEPSRIPRVEGYEWARLQEYNFYKTGALLRIHGACDSDAPIASELSDIQALDSVNDPEKDFNDRSLLGSGCRDQIHGVAKAAIRAALARVIADTGGNGLVLQIDPANGGDDLGAYRRNACFDFGPPPFDTATTKMHPCGSFEEYIATVATKAARMDPPLFTGDQLTSIVRFWCAKVDCDSTTPVKLIVSDDDANAFINDARAFIEFVEGVTVQPFIDTVSNDTKPIGAMPYLDQGPSGSSGPTDGIAAICKAALQTNDRQPVAALFAGDPLLADITIATPRKYLRLCNVVIVDRKVNGDPTIVLPATPLKYFQIDGSPYKAAKKRLGIKHYVAKALQVRALNYGAQTAQADLTLFEGNGTEAATYTAAKTVSVVLDGGSRRVIAKEPDPDHAQKTRPLFPVLFALDQPEIAPGQARALAFVIDPGHKIPEADKTDNQAAFFYSVLGSSNPLPTTTDTPAFATDITNDPLAIPQSQLSFTFRVRSRNGTTSYGGKDILVSTYSQSELVYELKNLGATDVNNVQVLRQIGSRMEVVAQVPVLKPKEQTGSTATLTDLDTFTATLPGVYTLRTFARAKDRDGNTVGPVSDLVYVTASDALEIFDIKLFDASPLAESSHPFTRVSTNTDPRTGQSMPLVGAVTDGDDQDGGGRIRISIDRLIPEQPATVIVGDAELPNVTDGVGTLTTDHLLQATITPDSAGHAELSYYPPAVFVRDAHRVDDFPKTQRLAKVTVIQENLGSTTRTIILRRPPVFLVHGLFSNRHAWDDFQPLVPSDGVGLDFGRAVRGFDGRFDVFAVGAPAATDSFASLSTELRLDIKQALVDYLPGFAVGKIDVVGHSMGGLLVTKLANGDPKIAAAIRKVITLNSPFGGSSLADKLVELREASPIKEVDLGAIKLDPLNPPSIDAVKALSADQQVKVKLNWCALIVQAVGMTPAFYLRGAVDDLRTTSAEIAALGTVPVPTHRIESDTNTLTAFEIGPSLALDGLWAGLAVGCGLTPDPSTVEWSANVIHAVNAVKTIAGALMGLKGEADAAKRLDGLTRALEKTAKTGAKQLFNELLLGKLPKPVFATDDDRIVDGANQLGTIPVDDPAATVLAGHVDHNSILVTSNTPVDACLADKDFVEPPKDVNGDGTVDAVCVVMRLLEADPSTTLPLSQRRFFKNQ